MLTSNNIHAMKFIFRAAIILLASLLFVPPSMAAGMAATIPWQELTPQQQQILAPLAHDWSGLSKKQQNNYIAVAKRYPTLPPLKQQRFQEQIVRWAKLTPAQRQRAREKHKELNQLPPEKRAVEKQALREKHAKKHPEAASAVTPAATSQPAQ
jgi:hypothetical protein